MKKISIITVVLTIGASMAAMSEPANPDLPDNGIAAITNAVSGIAGFRPDGEAVPMDPRIAELLSRCDFVHTNACDDGAFVWYHTGEGRRQNGWIKPVTVELPEGGEYLFAISFAAPLDAIPSKRLAHLLQSNAIRKDCVWCVVSDHLALRLLLPLDSPPEALEKGMQRLIFGADQVEKEIVGKDQF